ncbi:methyltransferase-domain-containing protein [Xylaria sp. CBS 124048]|nr:methyltransferase-domain-containing protein [Xylaria sp. CBS 124048]
MFAVPGWAVSTAGPKAETTVKAARDPKEPSALKKRKRQSGPANVTANNVADLWEEVIEGRQPKKSKPDQDGSAGNPTSKERPMPHGAPRLTLKEKKKLKKQKEKEESQKSEHVTKSEPSLAGEALSGEPSEKSKKGKRQREESSKGGENGQNDNSMNKAPRAPVTPKLTPMQAAMKEKLVSARFRHLNETLYTKPSTEAFQLFQDSPEMFHEYHEGFRRQVNVWPENPVDGYIEDIKLRGRQRHAHKSRPGQTNPTEPDVQPLMRTNGVCTIADLGCGDAKLATVLQSEKKRLNLNILSYDLQSPSTLVTKADIANLPLADGSVDVVIFCLALMGTNWLDFIEEAYRILHWKGELWVAEIKSRFGHVRNKAKNAPVSHSVGNRKKNQEKQKTNAKGKDAGQEANHDADLAIEVDGGEDKRQETNVTAFVEALQRRGFVLRGDEKTAVDMRNKMFVKMHFIKAAQPSVGKGVAEARDSERGGKKKGGGIKKFIDAQEHDGVDESTILKPSVYKVR